MTAYYNRDRRCCIRGCTFKTDLYPICDYHCQRLTPLELKNVLLKYGFIREANDVVLDP